MPSAGTGGPNVPRLTSPVKRVAKDGGGMDPPPSQPSSRASSATKRDTAGLITDLTRLKEITNDTRIQSATYRKDHFGDFDDEPDLPEVEVKEEAPREVSFGDLDIKDQDLVDDLSDLDEAEGLYDDNASQVSSLSTEPDLTEEYDTDLEVDEDSKFSYVLIILPPISRQRTHLTEMFHLGRNTMQLDKNYSQKLTVFHSKI